MIIGNVLVIGGTGFLGSHVVRQLAARGIRVRVPTRKRERAKGLILLPTVDVVEANVHDDAALSRLMTSVDAVINLVGVLHGDFERAHVDLPCRIVAACRKGRIGRLLHVSALGAAADAPSEYLRSKARGEAQVADAGGLGLDVTVVRPSVIFGPEDRFLNLFARLVRALPIVPLAAPQARFQPVFVDDVAQVIVRALGEPRSFGQTYDLCGPRVYTLQDLVEYVGRTLGLNRAVLQLGPTLSYLQALVLEHLPGKLMTRDNLHSMQVDNVCACPFPSLFGIVPTPIEAIVPTYIGGVRPRSRYRWFRFRARR
ncbi:MAG TPA: complex I NDUFA9 subunit family protein [Burkholderiales bacterium]|nr:complex I NDUFA9 subunit family protein [Burkholderiales bacterium]